MARAESKLVEKEPMPEARERYHVYSGWLEDEYGYKISPEDCQAAVTLYHGFQRSDTNVAFNEDRRAARAEEAKSKADAAAEKRAAREQDEEAKTTARAEKSATRGRGRAKPQVDEDDVEPEDEKPTRRGRAAKATAVSDAAPAPKRSGRPVVADDDDAPAAKPARKAPAARAGRRTAQSTKPGSDLF